MCSRRRDVEPTSVNYQPGESTTGDFGGNSNWRGPIWFPINFLLVEVLYKYHRFYGNDVLVEYPTGSGTKMTLGQVADDLSRRLTSIFLRDEQGRRACLWHQHDLSERSKLARSYPIPRVLPW